MRERRGISEIAGSGACFLCHRKSSSFPPPRLLVFFTFDFFFGLIDFSMLSCTEIVSRKRDQNSRCYKQDRPGDRRAEVSGCSAGLTCGPGPIGQSVSIASAQSGGSVGAENSLETAWRAESESLKSILSGAPPSKLGRVALVDVLGKQIRNRVKVMLPNVLTGVLVL